MTMVADAVQRVKGYYKTPYTNEAPSASDVSRLIHGMEHASRTAILALLWANLADLSQEDKDHIQVAALFHDTARQNEGEDLWDRDSALHLYDHLIEKGIPPARAALIAESMANKDAEPDKTFYELDTDSRTWKEMTYEATRQQSHGKFIDCIHDADCLEIMRARDVFDATYLRFYKKYVATEDGLNRDRLRLLSYVITQARGLIHAQGDQYKHLNCKIKKIIEDSDDPYQYTLEQINQDERFFALATLLNEQATKRKSLEEILEDLDKQQQDLHRKKLPESVAHLLEQNALYVRGIKKPATKVEVTKQKKKLAVETGAELEFRKLDRKKGVATKSGSIDKSGNPNRSISLLMPGMPLYSNIGLMLSVPTREITQVSLLDSDTGFGKKSHIYTHQTPEEIQQNIQDLIQESLLGGKTRSFGAQTSAHNEVIAHIHTDDIHAIYFTLDQTLCNEYPFAPAIFLQAAYTQQLLQFTHKRAVPIIEYQREYDHYQEHSFDETSILSHWKTLIQQYVNDIKTKRIGTVLPLSLENLKSHYELEAVDHYYLGALKEQINQSFTELTHEISNNILKGVRLQTWSDMSNIYTSSEISDATVKETLEKDLKDLIANLPAPDYSFCYYYLSQVILNQKLYQNMDIRKTFAEYILNSPKLLNAKQLYSIICDMQKWEPSIDIEMQVAIKKCLVKKLWEEVHYDLPLSILHFLKQEELLTPPLRNIIVSTVVRDLSDDNYPVCLSRGFSVHKLILLGEKKYLEDFIKDYCSKKTIYGFGGLIRLIDATPAETPDYVKSALKSAANIALSTTLLQPIIVDRWWRLEERRECWFQNMQLLISYAPTPLNLQQQNNLMAWMVGFFPVLGHDALAQYISYCDRKEFQLTELTSALKHWLAMQTVLPAPPFAKDLFSLLTHPYIQQQVARGIPNFIRTKRIGDAVLKPCIEPLAREFLANKDYVSLQTLLQQYRAHLSSVFMKELHEHADFRVYYSAQILEIPEARLRLLVEYQQNLMQQESYLRLKPKRKIDFSEPMVSWNDSEQIIGGIPEELLDYKPSDQYDALWQKLDEMCAHGYGLCHQDPPCEKEGLVAMQLAFELKDMVYQFINTPEGKKTPKIFLDEFKNKAHSKDLGMGQHRQYWKVVVANILLCVASVIHLIFTGHGFFAKTRREQLRNAVEKEAQRVIKPGDRS
ncbi:MAG: hypothetical protein NTW08_03400 [Gammaproteobacteria bacterium]|nr:hypothetical protein [Gammaproteobacteria bacterium]